MVPLSVALGYNHNGIYPASAFSNDMSFCRAVQRLSYHAWGGGSWRFLNYYWPRNFGSKMEEEETSKKIPEHPPLPEKGHVSQLVSFLVHFFFNFGHAEIIFWACRFQIFGVEDVFLLLDVACYCKYIPLFWPVLCRAVQISLKGSRLWLLHRSHMFDNDS